MIHLFAFIVLAPLVCLGVACAAALAVIFLIFTGGYLAERNWKYALASYAWFSVFSIVLVIAMQAIVTNWPTLLP
jgi:hypothetical protein